MVFAYCSSAHVVPHDNSMVPKDLSRPGKTGEPISTQSQASEVNAMGWVNASNSDANEIDESVLDVV